MKMKIARSFPPNYEDIVVAIPAVKRNPNIIFTYGDTLYVPSGVMIPPHLHAHEVTHCVEQAKIGVDEWWSKYLVSPRFRLEQELLAYRAQYQFLLKHSPRHFARTVLLKISEDLSGAMYGSIVDRPMARDLITGKTQL